MRSFEPCIDASVPHPLAALLRALLAVPPSFRPSAESARLALASLAAQTLSWAEGGGGAPGADAAACDACTPTKSTLVAYDVDGVDWHPAPAAPPPPPCRDQPAA